MLAIVPCNVGGRVEEIMRYGRPDAKVRQVLLRACAVGNPVHVSLCQ